MKNVEISLKKFSLKKGFITCLALLLGLSPLSGLRNAYPAIA